MFLLRYPCRFTAGLLLVCALVCCLTYAAGGPEAPPPAEVKATSAQGCSLTFESNVGGRSSFDSRHARLVALYVPANTPPTPFLSPGPFKATFETDLSLRLRDDVTFSLVGAGSVTLSVNGGQLVTGELSETTPLVAKTISLKKGKNRIVLEYRRPVKGDAFARLYWATSDFLPEPIPPHVLSYDAPSKDVRLGARVREGRLLVATLHCIKCHESDKVRNGVASTDEEAALQPSHMPELDADAPSLAEAGARLNETWMARWISNPRAMRPNAIMPKLFHGAGDTAAEARDIAAYLATMGKGEAGGHTKDSPADLVESGGRVFARLRCIACHTLPEHDDDETARGRTPLRHVKAKYKPGTLVAFLKAPEKHYAWTRMPNFKLSDEEAEGLAAFLLSREQKTLKEDPKGKGDATKGEQLVVSSGCLNCHSVSDTAKSVLRAPAFAAIKGNWNKGCLAPDDASRGKAPNFGLSGEQRDAILSFAATDASSLTRDTLGEFAERQIQQLNCVACHPRDDNEDLYARFQNETAELAPNDSEADPGEGTELISPDQTTPMLTWAGEKLRPEWMGKLIAGKQEPGLRPWLRARMTAFPARATHLARGLALQHGFTPVSPPHGPADIEMAKNGMKLSGAAGGFQCIACHGIGEMKPTSVFEAPGINFMYVEQRMRKHYYDRWVIAPMRIHKETKMPSFADQEGKTSIREIYDGDARKQYDAIWHYLLAGEKIRPPEN